MDNPATSAAQSRLAADITSAPNESWREIQTVFRKSMRASIRAVARLLLLSIFVATMAKALSPSQPSVQAPGSL